MCERYSRGYPVSTAATAAALAQGAVGPQFKLSPCGWAADVATALTSAVWAGVITEIVPNQMRGLAVAVAILVANLVGMGLGATIVAVVTDYVFNGLNDPLALGRSLAIVTPLTYLLSSAFGLVAILNYERALDYLKRWSKENSEV